ncbi:MAG: hypothetical protein NPIRA05_18910 [Nitrospirales bacterium]|nr:MAG: hypothetical protein NPIRA05_18910 [Nitrospirales bacterium]
MPLYEMTSDAFRPISQASFADLKLRERDDLQRLLRTQIEVLGDDLYVLTEEFSDWDDSRRRIDLLAIDPQANLVVIELKRTNDGGHMELQAIRYASMVSAMTFERAELIHGEFLARISEPTEEARTRMLTFLGWEEPDEEAFAPDVRIMLVSEDFGKELTTAVLWLRERDIDIRCVRLRPYQDGEKRLIDVQQIIPLPEANEYQVQLREKGQVGRKKRAERYDVRLKFWQGLVAIAHNRHTRHANIKPGAYHWIGASSGIRGLGFNYVIVQEYGLAELYIDRGEVGENKRIFDQLHARKDEIEKAFGGTLSWERLEAKRACRIKHVLENGGYRSPESEWPRIQSEMVDTMTILEAALKPELAALGL